MIKHPTTYEYLLSVQAEKGAGFIVLIDPDKLPLADVPRFCRDVYRGRGRCFFPGWQPNTCDRLGCLCRNVKSGYPITGYWFSRVVEPGFGGHGCHFIFVGHQWARSSLFVWTARHCRSHLASPRIRTDRNRVYAGRIGCAYDSAVHE